MFNTVVIATFARELHVHVVICRTKQNCVQLKADIFEDAGVVGVNEGHVNNSGTSSFKIGGF